MQPSEHNWDLAVDQTIPEGMRVKIDGKTWHCSRCGCKAYGLRNRPGPGLRRINATLEEYELQLIPPDADLLEYFSCDELIVIKIMSS